MFKKIIVGVDFSDVGGRAAELSAKLGASTGAQVVLVHVMNVATEYANAAEFRENVRPGLEEKLRLFSSDLATRTGAKVDWGLVDGRPAEELVTFAKRWGGDLIVMGTAGRTGVARALLGSVAERVVRSAEVPVMVVGPETPAG